MTNEDAAGLVVPLEGDGLARLEQALLQSDGADRRALASRLLAEVVNVPSVSIEAAEWHGNARTVRAASISPTSDIGRALTTIAQSTPAATQGAGTLYRMVLPPALAAGVSSGALKPMQDAAGIGIKSVIVDGSKTIRGHGSFVPVSLGRSAVVASLGVTVGLALVTAAVEYQARKDEQERLKRIERNLDKVLEHARDDEISDLTASWHLIKQSAALILDGHGASGGDGNDAAAFHARKAFQRASAHVDRWKRAAAQLEDDPTPDFMSEHLASLFEPEGDVLAELELVFSALQLERARILLVSEQKLRHSDNATLDRFRTVLADSLAEVKTVETDLVVLADRLEAIQLKMPDGILSGWWGNARTEAAMRAQRQLSVVARTIRQALAPAEQRPLAVDVVVESDGTMTLLDPVWVR